MTSEFRSTTWGEEISLEYGKGLRGYAGAGGMVPVFGTNGQVGWTDTPLTNGPGIILGRKGAYRGIEYCKIPFFVIDTAYFVKPKSQVNMRWLYYAMVHHQLGSIDDGSPIPSTTRAAVYVRELKVPGTEIQNSIAKILGDLDDKIEVLRHMNATLEAIARTVFRSWFVDFEPVLAKAAGATSFRGMPQDLFELLPTAFEPTSIVQIPIGWSIEPIGNLANCVGGGTPSTKEDSYWADGQHLFCTPKDMSDLEAGILFDTARHVTDLGLSKISSGALPKRSVLLSSRAPIGYIATTWQETSINQGIIALVPTVLPAEYLRFWLEFNMQIIEGNAGGTTFAEISKSKFRTIDAIRPKESYLSYYRDFAVPIFEKIAGNVTSIKSLTELRDTLLPLLISGAIEAPNVEALGLRGDLQ
jgi:type I restriction enzyme, S subunit